MQHKRKVFQVEGHTPFMPIDLEFTLEKYISVYSDKLGDYDTVVNKFAAAERYRFLDKFYDEKHLLMMLPAAKARNYPVLVQKLAEGLEEGANMYLAKADINHLYEADTYDFWMDNSTNKELSNLDLPGLEADVKEFVAEVSNSYGMFLHNYSKPIYDACQAELDVCDELSI
tara:strand:+ start:107871 stop:108386 length:516 start_codon:yes stop_codon:yes gene_type:complete